MRSYLAVPVRVALRRCDRRPALRPSGTRASSRSARSGSSPASPRRRPSPSTTRDSFARRQREGAPYCATPIGRKDEFLATLAHELRNPLAPIRNAVEILRLTEADPAAAASARQLLERQLKQLVRLIDDLLDVSRITQGRLELRREKLDLAVALRMAVETSRPLIEARQHTLHVSAQPDAFFVDADATRIAQVFANLLNNSAKYSPPGSSISARIAREGDNAVATITDNGVGIPQAMLSRVFEMFERVDREPETTPTASASG